MRMSVTCNMAGRALTQESDDGGLNLVWYIVQLSESAQIITSTVK